MEGKIDLHLHLAPPALPEETAGRLSLTAIRRMYRTLGIEAGVILPGKPGEDFFGGLLTNEDAAELCRQNPGEFYWFCNFALTGTAEDVETLRRYREMGAKGLGEFAENLPFDDPAVRRVLGGCEELGMPVLFHMSPERGFGYGVVDEPGLPGLEKALRDFPKLTFIGHSGCFWSEISNDGLTDPAARNGYPWGPVREGRLAKLMRQYPNLTAELSANSGTNAMLRDPEYAARFLAEFEDRLFFGTDSLVCALGPWLELLRGQGVLSESTYRNITRENALRLLTACEIS